ncbi:MAG TPA: DUF2786 domain-containing protein [Nocardioidaceae bacterium]|nr:DUF2786 domain-containing protein [Nocardioidaceae bacterium]
MNQRHDVPPALLAKVRKILTKAEDPATTPEEAELYTAKAAELIATYGIDQALLAESRPGSDVIGDRVVVLDAPYALDKASLLSGVAQSLRCQAVQRTRYDDGVKQLSMHLFGYRSDLARAELLYTSLLLQASTLLQRTFAPAGENVAAYRRSWLAGFTAAVVRRLRESEARAADAARDDVVAAGGRSVSLVLADRSVAVRSAVESEYPYLRRAQARSLSGSGGRSGYLAGQRADLGGTRVGGVRGQIGAE